MVLITEDVTLREIPWIASLIHVVRTVGWQRIGTLSQILSSRFVEADVAARAVTALIARTLQREAFVLACRDTFLLFGVMMLVSILAALCFRNPCSPEGCSNSLIERGPSMPIRTPSIVDDGRIRPIPAEVLQGE
jgi:MFS transporter, DHA2 family, multidrug resistance protein